MTPKELVMEAVAAIFVNFDATAAEQLLAKDYIQHNPAVPTGAAPILGFIPGLKESGIKVDIHRVVAEGNMVVLHTTYNNAQAFGADTLVGFDVFRVEDGKVAVTAVDDRRDPAVRIELQVPGLFLLTLREADRHELILHLRLVQKDQRLPAVHGVRRIQDDVRLAHARESSGSGCETLL